MRMWRLLLMFCCLVGLAGCKSNDTLTLLNPFAYESDAERLATPINLMPTTKETRAGEGGW
jgi:hypothetical protein